MKKEQYLQQQSKMLTEGLIDRRKFVMGALAAGVALPMALSMAEFAMAQTPKKGGRLRMGNSAASSDDSLDPATWLSSYMMLTGWSSANNLMEVGPDGTLVPELAESVESDDAQTWVFNLRKGVEFHNGKSLTADDILANFGYHMAEDSTSAAKGLLSAVTDVRKGNDHQVIFELAGPNADFPFVMSDYHLSIRPSDGDSINMASGIGTGGYVLQEFSPGVRTFATRNPNYWKEGRAHFDEIEIIALNDDVARQTALVNGDIDSMNSLAATSIALIERVPGLEVKEAAGFAHWTIPMRVNAAPFDNNDLRMALKLSIDRQDIMDKILLGHGTLGNDHPISPAHRYHNSDLPQRDYDPEEAAFYYKRSGHSGTIELKTSETPGPGSTDMANLFAASAAKAGIDLQVSKEPEDGYWSNVWNIAPFSVSAWSGRPTEDWMFTAAYTNDTEWNETAWTSGEAADEFNGIVVAARSELDDSKRRELYHEAQRIIADNGGAIVPLFSNMIGAASDKLAHGPDIAGNWENDGARMPERWWFA
ncbi:MAG: ABC transporter substrate-binding protein [Alphaproteobacteria bacterium]